MWVKHCKMHEDGEMTSMSTQTFWQWFINQGCSAIKHISLLLGIPEKIWIFGFCWRYSITLSLMQIIRRPETEIKWWPLQMCSVSLHWCPAASMCRFPSVEDSFFVPAAFTCHQVLFSYLLCCSWSFHNKLFDKEIKEPSSRGPKQVADGHLLLQQL